MEEVYPSPEEIAKEPWKRWIRPADDLVRQAYYRILGAISFHAPIDESIKAIEWLAKYKRGGTLTYWGRTIFPFEPIRLGKFFRVWSWDNLEVYPKIRMSLWVYGSDYSPNTAYLRKQWWRLYIFEAIMRALGLPEVLYEPPEGARGWKIRV